LALNYYDYFFGYPRANTHNKSLQSDEAFVQEFRLVSTWDKPINYVVGLYYQDQTYEFEGRTTEPGYTEYLTALGDPSLVPRPAGDLVFYYLPHTGFKFEDRAVFGELTWHVTPQWQLTGGVRAFHQEFRNRQTAYNYYFTPTPVVDLDVDNSSKVDDHIVKFNTSYDFTPELKLYATYSEGFRRGGANGLPLDGPYASLPELLDYTPDKSKNVEIGLKGMLFEGRMRYAVDVFDITLENYQFNSYSASSFPAVFNGTDVSSKGAELDVQFRITPELMLGFSYAYTNAKVDEGFTIIDLVPLTLIDSPDDPQTMPAVTIADGTRMPVTPRNSANAQVDYVLPLGSAAVQFHADFSYRGSAPGYIDPTSSRYWEIPSSTLTNARITYDSGNDWSADVFVNNLTDEVVYSGAFGTGQTQPNLFQHRYVGRPRTIGVGLHYKW
jgi:outer membrane receptor protein involved in Fe transport